MTTPICTLVEALAAAAAGTPGFLPSGSLPTAFADGFRPSCPKMRVTKLATISPLHFSSESAFVLGRPIQAGIVYAFENLCRICTSCCFCLVSANLVTNQITNARISLHGSLRIVDHLSSRGMSMTAIAVLHPRIVRIVGSAIHLHRARYLLQ